MPRLGTRTRQDAAVRPAERDSAEPAPITIVVADDHVVVRTGLRLLLEAEDGFEVVAEADDVASARRYVRAHRPNVLVLDLNMPGESSLAAIPALREEAPDTQIVVLTMQDDPAFAREALNAGALGFVLKRAAEDELIEAVRLAARGERYLNPQLGARIVVEPPPGPPDGLERGGGRDAAAGRARPHQRRDRRAAVPQRPHGRDPPDQAAAPARRSTPAPSWSATCSTAGCSSE